MSPLPTSRSITSYYTESDSADQDHTLPKFVESRPTISKRHSLPSSVISSSHPTPLQQIGIDARLRAKRESVRLLLSEDQRGASLLPRGYLNQSLALSSASVVKGVRRKSTIGTGRMDYGSRQHGQGPYEKYEDNNYGYQNTQHNHQPDYRQQQQIQSYNYLQHVQSAPPAFPLPRSHSSGWLDSIAEEEQQSLSSPPQISKTISLPQPILVRSTPVLPKAATSKATGFTKTKGSVLRKKSQTHQQQPKHRPKDWRKLPSTVLELIFDHLEHFHVQHTCRHCYFRSLRALQLTCKAWAGPAQRQMYKHITLTMPRISDALSHLDRQIITLRRTLRSFPSLAQLVLELHVPDPLIPLYDPLPPYEPNPDYDNYLSLLASLVMTVPNLKSFGGFTPFYNHTFDRLTHALSTRTELESHCWLIAENTEIDARAMRQCAPGIMSNVQVGDFLGQHRLWSMLRSLALCSPGGKGVLEHDVFVHVLGRLSSLEELCIAGFDKDDFDDATLVQAVPESITKLRLEELEGVTARGLVRWSGMPGRNGLEVLTLIDMVNLGALKLGRLLGGLDGLKGLVIVRTDNGNLDHSEGQGVSQEDLEAEDDGMLMQPVLASKSLEWLHWDIAPGNSDTRVPFPTLSHLSNGSRNQRLSLTEHLAQSIQHDGFPSLQRLRSPKTTDASGVLRMVCATNDTRQAASYQDDGRSGYSMLTRNSSTATERPYRPSATPMSSTQTAERHGRSLRATGEDCNNHSSPARLQGQAIGTERRTPLTSRHSAPRPPQIIGTSGPRSKDVVVNVRELELSDGDESDVTTPRTLEGHHNASPYDRSFGGVARPQGRFPNDPLRVSTGSVASSISSVQSSLSQRSMDSARTVSSCYTDRQTLFDDSTDAEKEELPADRYLIGTDWDKEAVYVSRGRSSTTLDGAEKNNAVLPVFWERLNLDGTRALSTRPTGFSGDPLAGRSGIVTWADYLLVAERRRVATGLERNQHGNESGFMCDGSWTGRSDLDDDDSDDDDYYFNNQKEKTRSKRRISWSFKAAKEKKATVEKRGAWAGLHVPRSREVREYTVGDLFSF